MNFNRLAQGSYAKFKVTAPDVDLTTGTQAHAFVYNEKGQILKQFSRVAQSGYTVYTPVPAETDAIYIEILPTDTKNVDKMGKFFVDVQHYPTISAAPQAMHNPSFLDENVLFVLESSVARDKSPS